MCRWFAYISREEATLLSDVLITPANAITKQCSEHYLPYLLPHGEERELEEAKDSLVRLRNALLNVDGLGVAWYTGTAAAYTAHKSGLRPALYKSQLSATNDFNFHSVCENTEATCLLAHIRATSGSAVASVNSHPFVFGRHSFMHNGVVSDFTRIRWQMGQIMDFDAYENIKGSTDSEHAAGLYMTFLCGPGSPKSAWEREYSLDAMKEALQKTVVCIMTLQTKYVDHDKRAPNSLNFCATDGIKMVTCRFRNHASQQPPSLYWSNVAGKLLNRKYPGHPDADVRNHEQVVGDEASMGRHTIVSSEPTTYDEKDWHLISRNCMLLVDENGVETEVPLEYDSSLDAKQ